LFQSDSSSESEDENNTSACHVAIADNQAIEDNISYQVCADVNKRNSDNVAREDWLFIQLSELCC